jgi:hypothetical protein
MENHRTPTNGQMGFWDLPPHPFALAGCHDHCVDAHWDFLLYKKSRDENLGFYFSETKDPKTY